MALWLWPHDHVGRCLVSWQLWHSWNRSFKLRSCSLIPLSFNASMYLMTSSSSEVWKRWEIMIRHDGWGMIPQIHGCFDYFQWFPMDISDQFWQNLASRGATLRGTAQYIISRFANCTIIHWPMIARVQWDSGNSCELLFTTKRLFSLSTLHQQLWSDRRASLFAETNGWTSNFFNNKFIKVRQALRPKQTHHHLTLHEAFQTMSRIPTKFLLHRLVDIIKRFVILNSPSWARTYGGTSKTYIIQNRATKKTIRSIRLNQNHILLKKWSSVPRIFHDLLLDLDGIIFNRGFGTCRIHSTLRC